MRTQVDNHSFNPTNPSHSIPETQLHIRRNVILNRKTQLHTLYYHPYGSLIEYPETTADINRAVGHIFTLNPKEWLRPQLNFAYSLGDPKGMAKDEASVSVLLDDTGQMVPCRVRHSTCESLKN